MVRVFELNNKKMRSTPSMIRLMFMDGHRRSIALLFECLHTRVHTHTENFLLTGFNIIIIELSKFVIQLFLVTAIFQGKSKNFMHENV